MNKHQQLAVEIQTVKPIRDSRAKDAVAVSVTFAVPNSRIALLKMDDEEVPRDGQGKATVKLAPGDHTMEWQATLAPRTEYAVSIDAPASVKWSPPLPKRSNGKGFASGMKRFTL